MVSANMRKGTKRKSLRLVPDSLGKTQKSGLFIGFISNVYIVFFYEAIRWILSDSARLRHGFVV